MVEKAPRVGGRIHVAGQQYYEQDVYIVRTIPLARSLDRSGINALLHRVRDCYVSGDK